MRPFLTQRVDAASLVLKQRMLPGQGTVGSQRKDGYGAAGKICNREKPSIRRQRHMAGIRSAGGQGGRSAFRRETEQTAAKYTVQLFQLVDGIELFSLWIQAEIGRIAGGRAGESFYFALTGQLAGIHALAFAGEDLTGSKKNRLGIGSDIKTSCHHLCLTAGSAFQAFCRFQ